MSYILDALKKSEQERRRGEMPEITRFESELDKNGRKHKWWPIIAVILVVVNLGLLIIWAPWQQEVEVSSSGANEQGAVSHNNSATMPREKDAIKVTPAPAVPSTSRQRAVVAKPPPSKPTPAKPTKPAVEPRSQPQESMNRQAPEPELIAPRPQSPVSNPSPPPRTSYLPQLQELSADMQQRIPDMSFSSHMYSSEPRFRSIIINGRRLKEGQYLNDEIQVRQITEKGVVLGLGETLFEVDVLGQWVN